MFYHTYENSKLRSGNIYNHEIRLTLRLQHKESEIIFNSIYRTNHWNNFQLTEERVENGFIDYICVKENHQIATENSSSLTDIQDSHFKRVIGKLMQERGYEP